MEMRNEKKEGRVWERRELQRKGRDGKNNDHGRSSGDLASEK